MIARLGQVIYWALSGAAALTVAFAIWVNLVQPASPLWGDCILGMMAAVLVWLFGRATLYILAAK